MIRRREGGTQGKPFCSTCECLTLVRSQRRQTKSRSKRPKRQSGARCGPVFCLGRMRRTRKRLCCQRSTSSWCSRCPRQLFALLPFLHILQRPSRLFGRSLVASLVNLRRAKNSQKLELRLLPFLHGFFACSQRWPEFLPLASRNLDSRHMGTHTHTHLHAPTRTYTHLHADANAAAHADRQESVSKPDARGKIRSVEGKYAQSIASHLEKFRGTALLKRLSQTTPCTWDDTDLVASESGGLGGGAAASRCRFVAAAAEAWDSHGPSSFGSDESQTPRGEDPPMDRRCPASPRSQNPHSQVG